MVSYTHIINNVDTRDPIGSKNILKQVNIVAFVDSIKVKLQIRKYRVQFSELLTITACANCSIVPCTTRIGHIKGIYYHTDFIY